MEVESAGENADLDNELMQKLNTLGTRDKEDLVNQFQSIVGSQLTRGCCSFYLDMGNWNLQTALGAYYDVMSSSEDLPLFEVTDESCHIRESSIRPGQSFIKTWRLRNIGATVWPNNLKLKFTGGTNFSHGECASLPPLSPNEVTDVTITMISPATDGQYEGQWRVVTLAGVLCGAMLKVQVNVDSSGMNSLTEQMSSLGQPQQFVGVTGGAAPTQPMSTPLRPAVNATPFCSPTGYGLFGSGNLPNNGGVNTGQLPRINEGANMSIDPQQMNQLLNDPSMYTNNQNFNNGPFDS